MSRVQSYTYNHSYMPAAPFIQIVVDGYDSLRSSVVVPAFVDTGADGTLIPRDILRAVGAEYADSVRLRSTAGGVQSVDRYTVQIQLEQVTVHGIDVVATEVGSESIIGRDVLNHLVLTLNGPAEVLGIMLD